MRMTIMLMLVMGSISLSACSSMSGNVVPEKGPTMEQVYDSMETDATPLASYGVPPTLPVSDSFHKLPNPELNMYVFPHLAGTEEVPIPGYDTEFSGYTRDHYVL